MKKYYVKSILGNWWHEVDEERFEEFKHAFVFGDMVHGLEEAERMFWQGYGRITEARARA